MFRYALLKDSIILRMSDYHWVSSKEASNKLGINEDILGLWRDIGYLKYGTHWKRSKTNHNKNKTLDYVYHLSWCKEEMEYWKSHHAHIEGLAA